MNKKQPTFTKNNKGFAALKALKKAKKHDNAIKWKTIDATIAKDKE